MQEISARTSRFSSLQEVLFRGSRILLYPNETAATAMIYCHKYSIVAESAQKLEVIDEKIILCTAILFLAGKSTENIRRIREVLNVVRYLHGLKSELLELKEYHNMKVLVVEQENYILRVVGFSTTVEVPHGPLLNISRYLRLSNEEVKLSWMFLNDSFFDIRILSTSSAVLACACIYLGVTAADSTLLNKGSESSSRGSINSQKWWKKLSVDDDILFTTADWIANNALSRIQSS